MDRSYQLQLFVNYRFEKLLGKKGSGPGEYRSVVDFKTIKDTLLLLDGSLGKIIEYSLKSNRVMNEIVNPELTQMSGFLKVNGTFYLVPRTFEKGTDPSKCLLYTLDEHNNLRELNFHYADLQSDKVEFAVWPYVPVPMRAKDDLVYFRLPFSRSMWIYDVKNNKVQSFKIDLDYPEHVEVLGFLTDLQQQVKILEEFEMVDDFFLLKNQIALWTIKGKFRKPPTSETCNLRFYTYEGKEVARFSVPPFVWNVEDSLLARWDVDTIDVAARYPYRITWKEYKVAP
jgi:hypothetical protein